MAFKVPSGRWDLRRRTQSVPYLETGNSMNSTSVLFIGDADWPEFRQVHRWLSEEVQLMTVADLAAAVDAILRDSLEPQLIVLAERWPGEFSPAALNRLRRSAPLARISELLGSWCDGTSRSGDKPSGTLRHYWHQWLARLVPEFAKAAAGECPIWGLPATATDEERLLALVPPPRPSVDRGLLAIRTVCEESAGSLASAAASEGFSTVRIYGPRTPHVTGIRATIWVATPGAEHEVAELVKWRTIAGDGPIVAVVSFPRIEDCNRLLEAGAAVVVSQPFWLDDLFGQLRGLLDGNRREVG